MTDQASSAEPHPRVRAISLVHEAIPSIPRSTVAEVFRVAEEKGLIHYDGEQPAPLLQVATILATAEIPLTVHGEGCGSICMGPRQAMKVLRTIEEGGFRVVKVENHPSLAAGTS